MLELGFAGMLGPEVELVSFSRHATNCHDTTLIDQKLGSVDSIVDDDSR